MKTLYTPEKLKADEYKISVFRQKQSLPYAAKVRHAEIRAREFYNEVENCHVSVGGLDSITLLLFLRSIGIDVPAISVSSLEDKSIQKTHKQLGVISLKPQMLNGCNYYGKGTTRSAPFATFYRQDILQLALDLNVPVPEIYGTIERDPDGTLRTTGAQRTGCSMCGFGIHLEKRPHRFDRLREQNPKEWKFWMHDMGWGAVLDYIGVGWEDEPKTGKAEAEAALRRNENG